MVLFVVVVVVNDDDDDDETIVESWINYSYAEIYPYPAGTESDYSLPPV